MTYQLVVSLALGRSKADLSDLRGQLVDTSGSSVGSTISSGFIEIGSNGDYLWYYAGYPNDFRGAVKFYSLSDSTDILTLVSINPQESEYVDAKVSTRASVIDGSGGVTVVSPVQAVSNIVTLVRGDDYSAADSHSLDWTDTTGEWPELTSGSVIFAGSRLTREVSFSVSGSVVTPTGTSKKVRAEPTAAQTGAMSVGDYQYNVYVTLSSGHRVTLVANSPMKVVENFG